MNTDFEIRSFCAKHDVRAWMNQPFRLGDDLCAANGHALCLLPGKADSTVETCDNPIVPKLVARIREASTAPVETIERGDPEPCRACGGSGQAVFEKCRECGGEGEVDAETDYSTYHCLECKSCNGEGGVWNKNAAGQCPECDGSGNKPDTDAVWLNDHLEPIQARYFNLIKDLPGLEVAYSDVPTGRAVTFRFDGGEGLIMNLRNQTRPSEKKESAA